MKNAIFTVNEHIITRNVFLINLRSQGKVLLITLTESLIELHPPTL